MPYYPLWQRILIALSQNISPESEYFAFYIDPIKAILEFTQQEEAHFLFVPVYQESKEYDPIFQHKNRADELQYTIIPNENAERLTLGELNQWQKQENIQIEFLTHQPLQFNGVEFIPYNMPLPNGSPEVFAPNGINTEPPKGILFLKQERIKDYLTEIKSKLLPQE